MNPTVAMIAFSSFILVAFLVEAQGRKSVTHAVWLPFFWMFICASRSISQWLNIAGTSAESYMDRSLSGSPVDKIILSLVMVYGIMIISKRKEAAVELLKNNKALIAFTAYLGISVLWSDNEAISLRRWFRLAGNFIMAVVVMTESDPMESVKSLFRRAAYLMIPLSVMLIKYFPHMGVFYTKLGGLLWVGVALMKNGLGHLCLVMIFFLIWDSINTWERKDNSKALRILFDGLIIMMGLWLIRGPEGLSNAYSSASIGSLIIGGTILIVSRVKAINRNFDKLGCLVILVICLFLVFEYSFDIIELIVTSMGRNMTFTDRVPLWNLLADLGMEKPFLGYGYGGFWTGERIDHIEKITRDFHQGHSGYLEIFLEGGFIAIILLVVLIVTLFRKFQRIGFINYQYAVFLLSFLTMILLANITESSFARGRDLLTFVFYIIALNYSKPSVNNQTQALRNFDVIR